jgi:hypothetical protein
VQALGRPGAEPKQIARARHELAKGVGFGKVARLTSLGSGTAHKRKREMRTMGQAEDQSLARGQSLAAVII